MPPRPSQLDGFVAYVRAQGGPRGQVADNLDQEWHVPGTAWQALLDSACTGAMLDVNSLHCFRDWCRAHQRQGPRIDAPPEVLGRAMTEPKLVEHVREGMNEAYDFDYTPDEARAVLAATRYLHPDVTDGALRAAVALGRDNLWATYDPEDLAADPEHVLTGGDTTATAADIHDLATLGDPLDFNDDVFVLVYERRDNALHTPTVADAGAVNPWFRPSTAAVGAPGRTAPPSGKAGVAEVVHVVVHGDRLTREARRYAR